MKLFPIRNPIRMFAVICVAVTSVFVMVMSYRLLGVLSGPGWCRTAIGADKADANSHVDAAASCVGLLTIQLKSLANNSYIFGGVIALCLLTLVVIVLAGARLELKANKDGVDVGISKEGAIAVEVKNAPSDPVPTTSGAAPPPPPPPIPTGPAMPEPKV